MIAIRTATLHDVDGIVDLWRSSNLLSSLNEPCEDLKLALAGPASTVFVATDKTKRIVGSVMAGHDGHRGNLYYIAVDPRFRLHGIGQQLMRTAESWLREAGVRKIHLLVLNDNLGVAPFYEKLGYSRGPAVLFRKWLARDQSKPSA